MRAYEGKEKEPLVLDPLAELLAGRRGMQAASTTLKVSNKLTHYRSVYVHCAFTVQEYSKH